MSERKNPDRDKIKALLGQRRRARKVQKSAEKQRKKHEAPTPEQVLLVHELGHFLGHMEHLQHEKKLPTLMVVDENEGLSPYEWPSCELANVSEHGVMQPSLVTSVPASLQRSATMPEEAEAVVRTKSEQIAMRVAARLYDVSVEDLERVIASEDEKLLGFAGMDWAALIMQILQVVMDLMGDCQFGSRMIDAIRRPNWFARAHLRFRASRIFRSGDPLFSNMGNNVVRALEEEVSDIDDSDLAEVVNEIQNPGRYMLA